jgi:hypothetical protein
MAARADEFLWIAQGWIHTVAALFSGKLFPGIDNKWRDKYYVGIERDCLAEGGGR